MVLAWRDENTGLEVRAVCAFTDPAGGRGFVDGARVQFAQGSWSDVARTVGGRPVIWARWVDMDGLPAGAIGINQAGNLGDNFMAGRSQRLSPFLSGTQSLCLLRWTCSR